MSYTYALRAIIAPLAAALTASLFSLPAAAALRDHAPAVPQRAALSARDFGQRTPLQFDSGQYPDQPASAGQFCDVSGNGATGAEPRPLGGRQWSWTSRDQRTSVTEVVTVWQHPRGAFRDVVSDTGYCRYAALDYPNYTEQLVFDGTTFVASWDGTVVMTVKVDRALVSVSVTGDRPVGELSEEALRLVNAAAARVDRANI